MLQEQEDVYFYITLLNENYEQPALPVGVEADLLRGMYRLRSSEAATSAHVQLLGAGAILREVIAAAEVLATDWGVSADIWSCPSFTLLARDGQSSERWNLPWERGGMAASSQKIWHALRPPHARRTQRPVRCRNCNAQWVGRSRRLGLRFRT